MKFDFNVWLWDEVIDPIYLFIPNIVLLPQLNIHMAISVRGDISTEECSKGTYSDFHRQIFHGDSTFRISLNIFHVS